MNLNELTIGELKQLKNLIGGECAESHPYTIGDNWFIRTVTHHLVGEIKSVGKQEIVLRGGTVMWVADDGRFTEAISKSVFAETEVYGVNDVIVGRGSVIDATRISEKAQVKQK